jgi:hypothetical protein
LSGSQLEATDAGASCTVVASQGGNGQWAAAPPVRRPYRVTYQLVNGNWGDPENTKAYLSDGTFSVPIVVTSKSSIQVGVELTSKSTDVCTVDGEPVSLDGSGTVTASISVSLHAVGTCTLAMELQGAAPTVQNQNPIPRSYSVLDHR